MEHAVAAHYAGGKTWGSKANGFYHGPWLFHREAAQRFVEFGQAAIDSEVCDRVRQQPDPPEASPDVFFGYVVERYEIPVQGRLWKEYSRNDLTLDGHLEEARFARIGGFDVLHGCKTQKELEFIIS
jgi:hypothetical protein